MLKTYGLVLLYGIISAFLSLFLITMGSCLMFVAFLIVSAIVAALPYILVFATSALIGCLVTRHLRRRYLKRRMQAELDRIIRSRAQLDAKMQDTLEAMQTKDAVKCSLRKAFRMTSTEEARTNLRRVNMYLDSLSEEALRGNKSILEGMAYSFKLYAELSDQIQTERTKEAIAKIEDAFSMYSKALENIYESSISQDIMEAEAHVESLNSKIRMGGLAPDDFSENKVA